ncbi:hypothetical protein JCM10213_004152 [Rhodosporidiobolus nylandii]
MVAHETGQCCVCGKETANRCGACAEADFSLFFCSREHQKLIWPAHKLVCGLGKCDPFRWPLLSEEEVEACTSLLIDDPAFLEALDIPVTPGPYKDAALWLVVLRELSHPDSAISSDEGSTRQSLLHLVRNWLCKDRIERKLPDSSQPLPAIAFQDLARFSMFLCSGLEPDQVDGLPARWWHSLLVFMAASYLCTTKPSTDHKGYHAYAMRAFLTYVAGDLRRTHPQQAQVILRNYKEMSDEHNDTVRMAKAE